MSVSAPTPARISSGPKRRRRASAGRPHLPAHDSDLRALSKAELLALVSQLRAQKGAADGSAPEATGEGGSRKPAASLFVTESVRSGQTIEFPEGDVVVIGSVGSGAEIVAGGSIHVYGTLRGRAVAGAPGKADARIFCRNLQAELLVIAGRYRRGEHVDPILWGRPVQARLEEAGMTLAALD